MRLVFLPLCLASLPLCAQWDLRLEVPRPTGQSLPQTLISGTGNRTLYVLKADEKSTSAHAKLSTCYGGCATVWPPVLASGTPAVSGKAAASQIGLTTRRDGTKQVTYNGLPLYYYAADTKAGQATGNHLKDGFGLWVGMLPSGKLAPDGSS